MWVGRVLGVALLAVTVTGFAMVRSAADVDPPTAAAPTASPAASPAPTATAEPSEDTEVDVVEEADDGTYTRAFNDSFSSNMMGWHNGKTGDEGIRTTSDISDGAYHVVVTAKRPAKGGFYRSLAPQIQTGYRNIEVEATARKAGVRGYVGLLCFQRVDDWGGYEFAFDSDGWVGISKRTGDDVEPLASDTVEELVRPRGGNTIMARCMAGHDRTTLALFLNGEEVLRTADKDTPRYRSGPSGVIVGTSMRGEVQAAFGEFQVRAGRQ